MQRRRRAVEAAAQGGSALLSERPTPASPGAAEAARAQPADASCAEPAATSQRRRPVRAHKLAVVARPEACTACGACVDSCPRGAIDVADVAVVDDMLCIGCGACVDACPNNVIEIETRSP